MTGFLSRKPELGDQIYAVSFPDGLKIPFRLLSYREYKGYRSSLSVGSVPASEIWETVWRRCVLSDFLLDPPEELKAGVIPTVGQVIFRLSGVDTQEAFLELVTSYRVQVQQLDTQMAKVIMTAFPGYKLTDLDDMTKPEFIRLFTIAEDALKGRGTIKSDYTFGFGDKEEKKGIDFAKENKEIQQA